MQRILILISILFFAPSLTQGINFSDEMAFDFTPRGKTLFDKSPISLEKSEPELSNIAPACKNIVLHPTTLSSILTDLGPDAPVNVNILIKEFRTYSLDSLILTLENISKKVPIKRLELLECSSIKFNKIFPIIKRLWDTNKLREILYSAYSVSQVSGRRSLGELEESTESAASPLTPGALPIKVERLQTFVEKVEDQIERCEDIQFSELWKKHSTQHPELELAELEALQITSYRNLAFWDEGDPSSSSSVRDPVEWVRSLAQDEDKARIKHIRLFGEHVNDQSIELIIPELLKYPNLRIIDLHGADLSTESKSNIFKLLKQESVQFVDMTKMPFGESVFKDRLLVKELQAENLLHKLIFLASDKSTIQKLKFNSEEEAILLKSHLTYKELYELVSQIRTRGVIHSSLKSNF